MSEICPYILASLIGWGIGVAVALGIIRWIEARR